MNKLIVRLIALLNGRKIEKKQEINYRTENIELGGETHTIKIPKGEIYKDAHYDETQASKTIYINLNDKIKEKISLTELETVISMQGKYIENQQKVNPDFFAMDEANIEFLEEKLKSVGVNLSGDEVLEIFDVELFYMKLINIIG